MSEFGGIDIYDSTNTMNYACIKITAIVSILLVSACMKGVGVSLSPNAQPGEDLIPPSYAGNFFTEVCLRTAPNFTGVPQAISGEPFVQHQETGTYFHKFADLSVKVSDYGCSLVFKSEADVDNTIAELAKGVTKNAANWNVQIPRTLDVTSNASPDGKGRYFRIGLPRS
ncbi:hypothetical protein [Thalassobius sp. Cn5-15]|uniref:hypothetical protein n=1 Tax=Thalassobius sp. Cn5-15 TaxID=2917763 RepID=UPI001EF17693|nr:hypothetical protein [Thalassobius sp. Cn5-15]MCG7492923.1 hypothetical protein [Thalassobius sp. Cn5-15]